MRGNFPVVLDFNRLFLKLHRSYVTNCRLFLVIAPNNNKP